MKVRENEPFLSGWVLLSPTAKMLGMLGQGCANIMMTPHQIGASVRTTIDIETDVLSAAKELARQKHVGVGKVVSELLRQALTGNMGQDVAPAASTTGFEPFPARGVVVSNELINRLRDAEGI